MPSHVWFINESVFIQHIACTTYNSNRKENIASLQCLTMTDKINGYF